jgi:hypothetical protein
MVPTIESPQADHMLITPAAIDRIGNNKKRVIRLTSNPLANQLNINPNAIAARANMIDRDERDRYGLIEMFIQVTLPVCAEVAGLMAMEHLHLLPPSHSAVINSNSV